MTNDTDTKISELDSFLKTFEEGNIGTWIYRGHQFYYQPEHKKYTYKYVTRHTTEEEYKNVLTMMTRGEVINAFVELGALDEMLKRITNLLEYRKRLQEFKDQTRDSQDQS